MGLPEGDPLGQMQGLQALGQGGEIAVREIPRHTGRRQRQDCLLYTSPSPRDCS